MILDGLRRRAATEEALPGPPPSWSELNERWGT